MWIYWSTRELQEEIGDHNLDFLESVIPALSENEMTDQFIGNRSKLAMLVESLKDHNYFRKRKNLEYCLYRCPQEKLSELNILIGGQCAAVDHKIIAQDVLRNKSNYEKFIKMFKLDERFLSSDSVNLEGFFDNDAASSENPKTITKPFKNLKNYQVQCCLDTTTLLEPNLGRAILQMPTGSGKTRTASELIAEHLNEPETKQVLWLANTRELCEQAIQCMVEVWDHLGKRSCRFNRVWDSNLPKIPDWTEIECVFSVMSLQTGYSFLDDNLNKFSNLLKNTTLLIVDEAHIAVAPTYSQVIREIAAISNCKILGLSATPGRTIEEESSALSDLFFNKICSLKDPDLSRDNTIAYLRSIGVMSKAFHQEIIYHTKNELTQKERLNLSKGQDYSKGLLEKLGADTFRAVGIIDKLKNLLNQDARIIMFAPSVKNSFLTSAILTFLGYKSVHISGDTPARTRDSLIDKFLRGEYQIMCNYGVLATGFDAPNVDVVCIARPTKSAVLYSQMIGRGLRGPKVGGTDQCLILEVRDNFIGQDDQDILYKKFQDYWSE